MIVQPDFLDHWKTQLLIETLNDKCAPLYLIRLWGHCQNRKTHRFPRVNAHMVKSICNATSHDAEEFENAMIDSGFIRIDDGEIVAHDWDEINSSLIAAWNNGKKGGRPKKKTHGLTQTKPRDNPNETDREEKIDKIDKIEKTNSSRSALEKEMQSVIEYYNSNCGEMSVAKMKSKTRESAIKARIKDYGIEAVLETIRKGCASPFLQGKNDTGWTASLAWMVKPANFVKVAEGNFKEKQPATKTDAPGRIAVSKSKNPEDFML